MKKTKICKTCGIEKPESDYRKSINKNGNATVRKCCKKCVAEKSKARKDEWYQENKAEVLKKQKEFHKKNKTYRNKKDREYHLKYYSKPENRKRRLEAGKKAVKNLTDSYVLKHIIQRTGLKRSDVPRGMIEAKRQYMAIKRELKE